MVERIGKSFDFCEGKEESLATKIQKLDMHRRPVINNLGGNH